MPVVEGAGEADCNQGPVQLRQSHSGELLLRSPMYTSGLRERKEKLKRSNFRVRVMAEAACGRDGTQPLPPNCARIARVTQGGMRA